MAAIITLRQEIHIGPKQKAATLTVKSYAVDSVNDKIINYEMLDGRVGMLPINNIAGTCELKDNRE